MEPISSEITLPWILFADFKLMPLFSQNDIEPFNGFHICTYTSYIYICMYIYIYCTYYIYTNILHIFFLYFIYLYIVHICIYIYIHIYIHVALIRKRMSKVSYHMFFHKLRWKPLARWVAMATSAMEALWNHGDMGMSSAKSCWNMLERCWDLPVFQPEEWAVLGISPWDDDGFFCSKKWWKFSLLTVFWNHRRFCFFCWENMMGCSKHVIFAPI